MKPRIVAALGVGLGLAAGGATAVAVGVPSLAGAAAPAVAVAASGSDSTTPPSNPGSASTAPKTANGTAKRDRGAFLADTLKPLVDDGTITQAQADKVIAALEAAQPAFGGGKGHGGRGGGVRIGLDAAAGALGISTSDLKTALEGGKSLADVAKDKGVDVQKVIDAIVKDESARIDQAVTAGKLTADQAATRKADLTAQVTKLVDQAFGKHMGPGGKAGAPDGDADDAPATTAAPSTTPGS